MAKFSAKPMIVNAYPVHHLMHDAKANWLALPEFIVRQYEDGKLIFSRQNILLWTKGGWYQCEPESWIVELQGGLSLCIPAGKFHAMYEQVTE